MAEEKPSPVTFHEYNIPSLNAVFAWSAALLLVVSVWMIWADYSREWKEYQRRFLDVETAHTRRQLAEAEKGINQKSLAAIEQRLAQGREARAARQADLERLRDEKDAVMGRWYAADQAYKFVKADLDVARYELEAAREHGGDAAGAERRFQELLEEQEQRRLRFEELDAQVAALDRQMAEIGAAADAASKELDKALQERTRLTGKIGERGFVNDYFRNLPLLDFMAPTLKVQQVVLPDLHEDVNFMTVPRVDRCHTCHLAIARPGYTEPELPPEFRTHSRYDLLIGSNHPIERFGCTGCHQGGGRAITFVDAAHTPAGPEEAKAWAEEHDWHRLHHWDFPMLPLEYAEAGCAGCHAQETRVPGADRLNEGRRLFEEYGCFGCHKVDRPGYEELRKVGPELAHIGDKVTAGWMLKWVLEPRAFRPTTRMPRFWRNSNTDEPTERMDYPLRDSVEAAAVVHYLMSRSEPYRDLPRPPQGLTGDAGRGRWVVENRGCKACHIVGPGDDGTNRYGADFGPELNQVGSKLTLDWLYAWIRDPKAMWPHTKMPDLRLTDQEALDAATWLVTLRNPEFDAWAPPEAAASLLAEGGAGDAGAARGMLETVTLEYLRKEATVAAALERLGQMDQAERLDYLGGKLIGRYGCFGCHEGIPAYENAQRIGTELTTWASKLLTQLDFGLIHDIGHTKHDWLHAKLTDPRVFDEGKVETKDPQDLLKMPNFLLTDEEVRLIMTNVLSFQRDYVQSAAHRRLDFAAMAIEKGRRVMRDNNCQGCHVIDDVGGGMEKVLEGGKPFAPPVLVARFKTLDGRQGATEQGAKAEPDWMFDFLKQPFEVRPWLNVRMPTFGLTDTAATQLVEYFVHHAEEPFPYTYVDAEGVDPALVAEGQKLFQQFQCVSCHLPLEEARKQGVSVDQLAPNLELTRTRLQYDWLHDWLKDPGAIQKDTRMPSFFYQWDEDARKYVEAMPEADRKIDAIRAYLRFHSGTIPTGRVTQARPAR